MIEIEQLDHLFIDQCKSFIKDREAFVQESDQLESKPLIFSNSKTTKLLTNLQHEIDYTENLIQERQDEIIQISRASNLINEIFQNIGLIVSEQQELIDNIEVNLELTSAQTKSAQIYIEKRERQEEKRSSRIWCFLIFSIIITIFCCTLLICLF